MGDSVIRGDNESVADAAKLHGFTCASAFIRYASSRSWRGRREELSGAEERLFGRIERASSASSSA